jgi:hypothetical protein
VTAPTGSRVVFFYGDDISARGAKFKETGLEGRDLQRFIETLESETSAIDSARFSDAQSGLLIAGALAVLALALYLFLIGLGWIAAGFQGR